MKDFRPFLCPRFFRFAFCICRCFDEAPLKAFNHSGNGVDVLQKIFS